VLLNGAPIPKDALVGAVASDLSVQPGAGVILVVAADVPYKTMLAAYGGIAALPDHPRIALPPRAWVEAATRARGGSQAQ